MAESALAMRDVMSREEEPSFVIKDPRYVKESTNTTSLLQIFNGRWLVGLGVIAMSFVFGQRICIPTRLASSCTIVRASCSTHADGIGSHYPYPRSSICFMFYMSSYIISK